MCHQRVTQKLKLTESSCFSQIKIEILHTANDTTIINAMWNIAHANAKQNYIV